MSDKEEPSEGMLDEEMSDEEMLDEKMSDEEILDEEMLDEEESSEGMLDEEATSKDMSEEYTASKRRHVEGDQDGKEEDVQTRLNHVQLNSQPRCLRLEGPKQKETSSSHS